MFGILQKHHSQDAHFLGLIVEEMAQSVVDWRCSVCWRTNKANTQKCARCGIKWTHGNDPTYVPQKEQPKSPRRSSQSWNYTGWNSSRRWDDASWKEDWEDHGQTPRSHRRGNTPRHKTPKQKQKDKQGQYTMPAPEPPWHSQYRGDQVTVKVEGDEGQEASENLTLLAAALVESNTPVPAKVKHIVSEHSTPLPTAKGLKTAVDKMDKARKKLKEAQKARANLHANWRKYLADSVQRWTQFAEQFGKDDQDLASKVTAAQERLQSTKEDVDAKKTALEELEEDVAVEITDDEMTDKIDTAEDIQENINAMVNNLQNLQQKADAAIVEAAEGKNKRQRTEARDGDANASHSAGHAPGRASTAMQPFGVPDK